MSDHPSLRQLQLERIVFFSDAVFAIAITILVLEIRLPEIHQATDAEIWRALRGVIPKIGGFVFSFLVIGAYWEGHHRSFGYIVDFDRGLVWRNLLLLLTVSFMPFPTAVFSDHPGGAVPLVFYAMSLAAVGLCSAWLWRHASKGGRFLRAGTPLSEVRRIRNRTLAPPVVCTAAIVFSFILPPLARICLLLIPVAVSVGDRLAGRRVPETAA
jgi:uncharacterized membrane protein